MPNMRVNLDGMFKKIIGALPSQWRDYYACGLEEFQKHLEETVRGEHTLAEFADFYCLTEPAQIAHQDKQQPDQG